MKIAVVHSFYASTSPSGENSTVESQVELLRSAGHEVDLVARYTDDEVKSKTYPLRAAVATATRWGPDPSRRLEAFDPDVVLLHNVFPNWGSRWLEEWGPRVVATLHNHRNVCAGATMFRSGAPCSLCLDQGSFNAIRHGCYRDSSIASVPLAIATRRRGTTSPVLRHAGLLLVLNEEALVMYRRLLPTARIELVPNFVPDSRSVIDPAKRRGWVYVGRLSEEKGVGWLAKHWPKSQPMTLIGDGPLRPMVEGMAASNPDKVSYLGSRSHGEVLEQIAGSEGVIIPSLCSEGLPTVALEAFSVGTPVVISDRCASSATLKSQGAARVFSPQDAPTLEAQMRELRLDHGMFRVARQAYEAYYSPSAWLTSMTAVFDSVAKSTA